MRVLQTVLKRIYRSIAPFIFRGYRLTRFRPVKFLYNLVYRTVSTPKDEVEVQGFRMRLDPKDTLGLSVFGVYEPMVTELIKKNIRPGDTVVDVGANIGYYSLIMSRATGPEGKVYAFEPGPENFSILEENIRKNSCLNVHAAPIALADSAGDGKLYLSDENRGDHRVFRTASEERPSVDIRMQRLDEYLRSGERVDLIKMDIQGSEYRALEGMGAILDHPGLKMVMEFSPDLLREAGTEPSALVALLRGKGFQLFFVDERKKMLQELGAEWQGEGPERNIFCIKK